MFIELFLRAILSKSFLNPIFFFKQTTTSKESIQHTPHTQFIILKFSTEKQLNI